MKELRVGIVGTGSLAGVHARAYRANPAVKITSVCDINGMRARQFATDNGIGKAYDDYREMVQGEDVDAISIVTWNNSHAPITLAALGAGKHVLCEKPPALNAAQAVQMAEAAKRSGRLLMFGFVKRFSPYVQVMKEYIDKGELGEIYYAKTGYMRRCGNPGGWFATKSLSGGGPLIDLGVHIIDLSMYLMGKPKPVSVFGNTDSSIGNRANIKGHSSNWYKAVDFDAQKNEVEDFANAIVKFENGASLYFETSWTMHIKKDLTYCQIYGDKGGAELEPGFEIYTEKNNYLLDLRPVLDSYTFEQDKAFSAQINHFTDCILNGASCMCPAEDGVTIMKIFDAVYESSRSGELVKL